VLDPDAPGRHLQIDFPAAAHAGAQRLTYWLSGDEPLEIDVQVAAGPRSGVRPLDVTCALVIDGRQTPFAVGASPARVLRHTERFSAARQVRRFRIRLPGAAVRRGAHSAALVLWDQRGGEFPGIGFTIYKESLEFTARAAAAARTRELGTRFAEVAEVQAAGEPRRRLDGYAARPDVAPDRAGRLALRAALQRPAWVARAPLVRCALVAFLDGRQVPMEGLGLAPRLELPAGRRVELDLVFTRLPRRQGSVGGHTHTLTVYALYGDGQPAEVPPGSRASWASPPRAIAAVAW
jgi:hypothetical protein